MRVNIDEKALGDPRIKRAGARMKMHAFEVLGRLVAVWMHAYSERSPLMKILDVDTLAERDGFSKVLIEVDMAQARGKQSVRLRGVEERIQFLLVQDRKREAALEAKRKLADVARTVPGDRPPGRALDGEDSSKVAVPRDVPGRGPNSLTLTLTPTPDHAQPLAPAREAELADSSVLLLALPPAADGWKPPPGSAAVKTLLKRIAASELTIEQCVRFVEDFHANARGPFRDDKHRDNAMAGWARKHDPTRTKRGQHTVAADEEDYEVSPWG